MRSRLKFGLYHRNKHPVHDTASESGSHICSEVCCDLFLIVSSGCGACRCGNQSRLALLFGLEQLDQAIVVLEYHKGSFTFPLS